MSRPDASDGFLPVSPGLDNQLATVWQSQWDDNGTLRGSLLVNQIDPQLNVLNVGTRETVLWINTTDPPEGEAGWFSMTTVLSQTGIDLTTSEFLEFYASTTGNTDESLALIVDIGTINEDAYVADSLGNLSGIGDLDQEVDPIVGVWGNQDDTGLWGTGCRSETNASAWPLGDPRANCTNNNGLEDSEDLNRDNFLNTDERYFRYIVPLTQPSRYLNRPTGGEFEFNLYRLPLRLPDLQENANANEQQNVKHVRITLTSAVTARVLLSRMQFTGSPWLKRAGSGSVEGQIGDTPGTAGQVAVGPISTVDQGYVSPPGIFDQEADKTDELRLSSSAINEQALQIVFSDIPVGERIEVFRKFTDRSRDFLPYGRMRAWSLAQGDDWGPGGSLRFFIRMGFDSNNFYLYRTPLQDSPEQPARSDWLPEDLIEFSRLLALRAEAERLINENGSNLPGDTTFILWDVDVLADGDSTLALVINDRSRAPNLSAIREMALGIENVGTVDAGPGQVWVNDLRLDDAPDRNGVAALANLEVDLADVLSLQANVNTVNPFYRQLGEKPSFVRQLDYGGRATLQFGKFLPDSWGLVMPVGFAYASDGEDPFFLPQTDVLAAPLGNLRTGGFSETRWNVALSKQTRSGSPLLRATIDGLRLGYTSRRSTSTATLTEAKGTGWGATGGWSRQVIDKSFPLVPSFLRSAIDALPAFISQSVLMQNFKGMRFRWTPRQISLGAALSKSEDARRRFQTSTFQATDGEVIATTDLQHVLRPRTAFQIQPFPSVVWGFDFQSARDLVAPSLRASRPAGQQELERASRTFLGAGVGWETSRNVRTDLTWRPRLATWFDTDFLMNTNYRTNRNVSYIQDLDGDTTLVRDLSMERDLGFQFDVRPDQFLTAFGVASGPETTGIARSLRAFWDRLAPVRVDWRKAVSSTYDRRDLFPTVWDQLVLTGFNTMRVMNSDTASAAGDTRAWSVQGGYLFPLGLDFDVGYSSSDRRTITVLSERRVVDREWPSLELRWRTVPIPGFLDKFMRDITLSGAWRTRETQTSTTTGQDRGSEQTVRSLGLVFILVSGFNIRYDFDNTASERLDATGLSQSDRASH
ncbi:MAG: cell surface protein SprA, partial [Gemmatimonadetes bacterium]|nr:cell surface protein SprA [Gemmatimonadota bacterium]